MAQVAIAVTVAAQDTAGIVPTTASNAGASISNAVADLAVLNTERIAVAALVATLGTEAATANTDALATVGMAGTVQTDWNAVKARATIVNDASLLTLIAAQDTAWNTCSADIAATSTAVTTVVSQTGSVSAALVTLGTLENTVSADLVAAEGTITSGSVFIQCDTGTIQHIGQLSGAFQAALSFAQAQSLVPP